MPRIVTLLLLIFVFTVKSMTDQIIVGALETGSHQIIEFEGKKLTLAEHIRISKIDTTHPFSANSVFRVDEEKKEFTELNNVLTYNFNNIDLTDINNGNWVFTSFYTNAKTHLNHTGYMAIGALILGTRKPEIAEALFDAALEEQIEKINNFTRQHCKTSAKLN